MDRALARAIEKSKIKNATRRTGYHRRATAANAAGPDALDSTPRWLASAWNALSVVPAGRRNRRRRDDWRVMISTLLAVSCAYVLYAAPELVCAVQRICNESPSGVVKGMFPRVVAAICLVSRLNALMAGSRTTTTYERKVAGYRALEPMTRAEARAMSLFARRVALGCSLLVVPLAAVRLCAIALSDVPGSVTVTAALVSTQNFSACCVETHFAVLCHALCRMFAGVNRDLAALKADTITRNRYPAVLGGMRSAVSAADRSLESADNGRHLQLHTASRLRRLKTMHGLVCEAADCLNAAFGVHLGLSLCALCLYFMFDAYYHILGILDVYVIWGELMFFGSIAQYVVRFLIITILAHVTTKQASESKILLTDINNRFLDKNTKEEIQLFLNQISSYTIKFTAIDFFTLNIHLITSAVAAGITYLVILLQFNSSNN